MANILAQTNCPSQDIDATLRIAHWNAGSLNACKFLDFKQSVLKKDVDIFFIVEAGLATENPEYYLTPGYNYHQLKRSRQIASGIILGIKKNLTANFKILQEMHESNKMEAVLVEVWKNRQHFNIVNLYNPPGNKPNLTILEQYLQPNTIYVGDFNSPSLRWGYQYTTPAGRCVENFIDENHIDIIDTDPTFLSFSGQLSRPDLVLVHPNIKHKTCVALLDDAAGCGHRTIYVSVSTLRHTLKTNNAPRWNFKRANWNKFKNMTDNIIGPITIGESPERTLRDITEGIIKCAHLCIPRGKIKFYKPFWNQGLSKLKNIRNKARKKAEKSKSLKDCISLRKKQAELQKAIKTGKGAAFRKFISKIDYRKDGIKAHRYVSKLCNDDVRTVQPPIKYGNKTYTDPKDMANIFCKYYAKVSRTEINRNLAKALLNKPKPGCQTEDISKLMNEDFSLAELDSALSLLKGRKSAGPDEIFPEFLKNLGKTAKLTLLQFINLTWSKHVPQQWRKGIIIPIPKKGKDNSCPEAYRPITLTSSLCKLAERMVARRLTYFLESENRIDEAQAGFRKHRCTMDQVVNLTQHIKDAFHRKMSTVAVFVDFKAAYDTVWRNALVHKLSINGVSGNLFHWIKSFLSQRQITVRFAGQLSKHRIQQQGLPQGAVISCLLFNVMINDVIAAIKATPGVEATLYADDLLIWATSSKIKSIEASLNKALEHLKVWSEQNAMMVNTNKTVFQLFTLSTKVDDIRIIYKGEEIEQKSLTKYLGVSLDKKLSWKPHIQESAEKASKRSRILKRLTGTKWGANQDVLISTYKSYIRPVLEYGCEATITATNPVNATLNLVQNAALRTITGGAKSTPIHAMEAQTGIQSLQYRREMLSLCFWERNRRVYYDRWKKYLPASSRLKTQATPLDLEKNLLEKYQIIRGEIKPLPVYKDAVTHLPPSILHLDNQNSPKYACMDIELRQAALQTINTCYPSQEWMHIYTDGSSIPSTGNTGAGYYCTLFEGCIAVGTPLSNFDGEVAAILEAARKLEKFQNPAKAVFLIDSQAAMAALSKDSFTDCERVLQCRKSLNNLLTIGWQIVLQWIPSHVGIKGNERADTLAKTGTTLPQSVQSPSLHSARAIVKSSIQEKSYLDLLSASEGKTWAKLLTHKIPYSLPRAVSVASFRTITGHDFLASHLYKIGVFQSPACPLCGASTMDAAHLTLCPELAPTDDLEDEFNHNARLYWSARHKMAEMPRVGVG